MRQLKLVLLTATVVLAAALTGLAQSATETEQVVFSVKDLARSEEVYTSVMGFRVRDRGEGTSASLQRLWNLPPGTEMKWVLLEKPEAPASMQIRLVQFTPQAPRSRYEYREQDGGYLDIHVPVADVVAAYKALTEKGFTAMHEPVLWRGGGGEFGVGQRPWHEVFMHGFDGEGITLIPGGPEGPGSSERPRDANASPFSPIRNVTLSVSNLDEAYAFYCGVLGWQEVGKRWEGFGPDMEKMLRLPVGTVARPIFLRPPGNPSGSGITPTEFAGTEKIDLSNRNAPPYRGFIMLSLKTPNIQELYQRITAANVKAVMPPLEVSDPPYAGSKAFTVLGPDGVFIEFIERKSP